MEENKGIIVNEENEDLTIQDTFNEDGIELLVEEGSVENEYKN